MEYKKQAFPKTGVLTHPSIEDEEIQGTQEGMTLLDYFAAKVIQNLASIGGNADVLAESAYEIAAAMINERKNYIP